MFTIVKAYESSITEEQKHKKIKTMKELLNERHKKWVNKEGTFQEAKKFWVQEKWEQL